MAHPFCCLNIYKLPTSLGALPCTAKAPRPLSVARLDDFSSTLLLQTTRGRTSSLFSKSISNSSILMRFESVFECFTRSPEKIALPRRGENITSVCSVSQNLFFGVSEGKVLEWRKNDAKVKEEEELEEQQQSFFSPRTVDGLTGITIVHVCSRNSFTLLLTDRGILLSYGRADSACLGHGDDEDVFKPKIVEALLGDEVSQISCSDHHVLALTSDSDLFSWGRDVCGCLGLGSDSDVVLQPTKVEFEEGGQFPFSEIDCSDKCTLLITSEGSLFLAGESAFYPTENWEKKNIMKSDRFQQIPMFASKGKIKRARILGNGRILVMFVDFTSSIFMFGSDENMKELRLPLRGADQEEDEGKAEKIDKIVSTDDFTIVSTDNGQVYLADMRKSIKEENSISFRRITFFSQQNETVKNSLNFLSLSLSKDNALLILMK